MAQRLDGKVALVTGASSGLGKATALAFAAEGAAVVVASRRQAETEATAQLIREQGGDAQAVPTDVTSPDGVTALVDETVNRFGRLDVAFNNAGVFPPEALVHEIPEEQWDALIDTNLKGTWLCMRAELTQMVKQGSGTIVNMASSAAVMGWADSPVYAASKHGVIGLTKSAALQYAPMGIRINAVCPAFTRIEAMAAALEADPGAGAALQATIPLGRVGEMRETAEAAVWLASDASSFTVGHALVLDGGQTLGLWSNDS